MLPQEVVSIAQTIRHDFSRTDLDLEYPHHHDKAYHHADSRQAGPQAEPFLYDAACACDWTSATIFVPRRVLFRGARGLSQPPIDDIESYWSPSEKAQAARMLCGLN